MRLTEAQLLAAILELAGRHDWHRMHLPDTPRHHPRTDNAGFPDLLLVRRDRLVAAEIKVSATPRPEQRAWLSRLERAGVECYWWRQGDYDRGVVDALLRREAPGALASRWGALQDGDC